MLYLNPPYFMIDGIVLLPDDNDPLQWYYLPVAPHFTTTPDPVTGLPVPSVSLLLYHGADGASTTGGFFSCDVNLGVSDTQLTKVAGELQGKAGLSDQPRLAPISPIDGSVELVLLDEAVNPPPAGPTPPGAPAPPPSSFVTFARVPAKPSLYGDEQASLSGQLNQNGAVLLAAALRGAGVIPVGLIYTLQFVALRPAYTVTLNVDWNRVQHELDQQFSAGVLFFSSDIDKAVSSLIDNRVIDLQVDTYVPEGPDAASVITDKDKAVAEVREMIVSTFFTSSIDPTKREPDGWDKATGFIDHLVDIGVTGGASTLASFSYKSVDLTRIDQKTLNVRMSERSAVVRTICPQGHLSSIVALAAASGIDIGQYVRNISLDDAFFKLRTVTVNPIGVTSEAGILSIDAELSYGGSNKSLLISAASPQPSTLSWNSVLDSSGQMQMPVQAKYTVSFADQDGLTRPKRVTTPQLTLTEGPSSVFNVFPPADVPYTIRHIPISTPINFPWDRYPQVDVDLRYGDDANGITQTASRTVTEQAKTPSPWTMFTIDPDKRTFQARLTYHGAAGRQDHVEDWADFPDGQVSIPNPFSQNRTVTVWPPVDFSQFARLFVDMAYDDDANNLHFSQSYEFDAAHTQPAVFVVGLADTTLRKISYSVTFSYPDGHTLSIPTSFTLADRLVVSSQMRGTQIVTVKGDGGDFGVANLTRIDVDCSFADTSGSIKVAETVTLDSGSDFGYFQFPFTDPGDKSFSYAITWRYANGLVRSADPTSSSDDTITVTVA